MAVLKEERKRHKEAEAELVELRVASTESVVRAKRLMEENRRLKIAVDSGVGQSQLKLHEKLMEAESKLENIEASWEAKVMDLQQAIARERQRSDRADEEREEAVTKCQQILKELRDTNISTGAELQAVLIEEKIKNLQNDHERASELIEVAMHTCCFCTRF